MRADRAHSSDIDIIYATPASKSTGANDYDKACRFHWRCAPIDDQPAPFAPTPVSLSAVSMALNSELSDDERDFHRQNATKIYLCSTQIISGSEITMDV